MSHQPKKDIDTWLTKAWIAIDRLSVIRESDLTDKMKRSVDTAIWMHYMDANKTDGEKAWRKLHQNYASNIEQVLEATPHKAPTVWPPTSHQVRRTRHAGHCWRYGVELIRMFSHWPPHMAEQKQGDQLEPTYSSSVRIRDVALRTCQKR